MAVDRPAPGEEINTGVETKARAASSVIVLRDAADGPEVLLVERNPESRFMGGAWVFPGGAVREGDADPAATGVRELEEEAGIALGSEHEVVPFSRWITPAEVKIRFDTWFFVARAPEGAEAKVDGEECVDARWLRPADALDELGRGELMLVFPTIKHLEQLAGFGSVDDALASARARDVQPVQPRVVVDGDGPRVLMPGEPGYDG
ncbi:MAG: NUDIX hydrolase [Thermoleophilaceae bacterium]